MFSGPRLSRVIRPIIFRWCCCYWFTHQRIVLETGKTTVTSAVDLPPSSLPQNICMARFMHLPETAMSPAPIVSIPAAAWYCKFLRTYGTLSGRPLRPYLFLRSTTSCTKNVVNVGERCLCEYTTSEGVLVEYYPQSLNQPGTGSNPACGQPNSKTYFSPVPVRV